MNCEESFEFLYRFIDNDLDGASCAEIEVHLKICRPCWDRFEFEKKLKERCRKSCHQEPLTEEFRLRIKALLDKY